MRPAGGPSVVRAGVLAASATIHAGALLLVLRLLASDDRPPRAAAPDRGRFTVLQPSVPLEITLIDGDALPIFNPPATPLPAAAGHRRAASVAAGGSVEEGKSVPSQIGEETGNRGLENGKASPGLMHMRGPDLALAPDTAARIAAGGGALPEKAHESGKLENAPGGGAVIHDRVTTVAVERDGTAHFHDKPDVVVHFHSPIPHIDVKQDLHDLGDALQDWYRDPYAGTRYGPTADLSEVNLAVQGACDTWGDVGCDDPLAPETEKRARKRWNSGGVGFFGPADVSAYLYRKLAHADPYAARKRKLLDDTFDERVERGAAFRAEQAARSAELMQRTLEELWTREHDPAARKQALFELWSDCATDDAGRRARAMVIGWIRAKLPEGTAAAYTPDELARLAPFSPYQ
jgi:hypothetical protein